MKKTIDQQKNEILKKSNQITNQTKSLENSSKKERELENRNKYLIQVNNELADRCNFLVKEKDDIEAKLNESIKTEKKNAATDPKIDDWNKQVESLKTTEKKLKDQNSILMNQLNEKSSKIIEMKSAYEQQINELQTKLSKEKTIRKSVIVKYKKNDQKIQLLTEKLKREEDMNISKSAEVSLLVHQLDDSTQRNDKKSSEILKLKDENKKLNSINNELIQKIEYLSNKKSDELLISSTLEEHELSDSINEIMPKQIEKKENAALVEEELNQMRSLLSEKDKQIKKKICYY